MMEKYFDYRLCYIDYINDGHDVFMLYYTDNFENQRGDDWDDRPASCNASAPYEDENDIFKIMIQLDSSDPIIFGGSTYSVDELNSRRSCWLVIRDTYFNGGDTLLETLEKIYSYNELSEYNTIDVYIKYSGGIE